MFECINYELVPYLLPIVKLPKHNRVSIRDISFIRIKRHTLKKKLPSLLEKMENKTTLWDPKIRWRPRVGFLETGRQTVEDLAKIIQLKIRNYTEMMVEAHTDMMEERLEDYEQAYTRFVDAGTNRAVWEEELNQLCRSKLC